MAVIQSRLAGVSKCPTRSNNQLARCPACNRLLRIPATAEEGHATFKTLTNMLIELVCEET